MKKFVENCRGKLMGSRFEQAGEFKESWRLFVKGRRARASQNRCDYLAVAITSWLRNITPESNEGS
ncbi:MAG: hypothetical protein DME54_01580 [Verrucomicrobia bacterium]|nr:MAG: hypothetical protein DME62_04865 [Verrucomicrobiota bacterium]PYK36307.1 MAG: hypothetical protein DME54_01580 [Verrucomicrobiota bacterium]PYL19700.1 MAG: hypothetical protein DMF41_08980 [Verrucomicrobiota bacterium]PYL80143.1 MAG: hypothetical protein DMF21_10080 [Verrucomicrobiota bacterium]